MNRDKHVLYEQAFQSAEGEAAFYRRVFESMRGRAPLTLREDFCGTAAISAAWVQADLRCRAIAVDVDPEQLWWCREYRLSHLVPKVADRIQLRCANAVDSSGPNVDLVLAPNSSICLIRDRPRLIKYLRNCRASLATDGLFVATVYAGPDSQMPGSDRIQGDGFVAVWEQASFDPATNEALNRIHFEFPDGSRMETAFEFHMRLWTPAELTDALRATGFADVRVYQRRPISLVGEFDEPQPCRGDMPEAWEAYLVALT